MLTRLLPSAGRLTLAAATVVASTVTTSVALVEQAEPACAAAAPDTVRVETYNVLSNKISPRESRARGPLPARMARLAHVLTHNSDGVPADVVGLQEVSPRQYPLLRHDLPAYDAFPGRATSTEQVFWRRSRFDLVRSGTVGYPGYRSRGLQPTQPAPWVELRDRRTGHLITVLDQRSVAWNTLGGSDCGGALKREASARIFGAWTRSLSHRGRAAIALGDWNSAQRLRIQGRNFAVARDNALGGRRALLPYCVLGRDGLRESIDVAQHRAGICPSHSPDLHFVDHLYVDRQVQVLDSARGRGRGLAGISDHRPTYADVRF